MQSRETESIGRSRANVGSAWKAEPRRIEEFTGDPLAVVARLRGLDKPLQSNIDKS